MIFSSRYHFLPTLFHLFLSYSLSISRTRSSMFSVCSTHTISSNFLFFLLFQELSVLRTLEHPFIVHFFGCFQVKYFLDTKKEHDSIKSSRLTSSMNLKLISSHHNNFFKEIDIRNRKK